MRGIVALEPKGPPFFDLLADPTTSVPHRPFGLTATPLTYQPPLAEEATVLPFTSHPAPPDEAPGTLVHQPNPPCTMPNLAGLPVLVVTGEASDHTTYDHHTVDFLRDAGVAVEHVHLSVHGIHGNGHLLTLEHNRDEIAELIERWLINQTA